MKCPNCGETSRIREKDRYCHKCGCNLKNADTAKKERQQAESIVVPTIYFENMQKSMRKLVPNMQFQNVQAVTDFMYVYDWLDAERVKKESSFYQSIHRL